MTDRQQPGGEQGGSIRWEDSLFAQSKQLLKHQFSIPPYLNGLI